MQVNLQLRLSLARVTQPHMRYSCSVAAVSLIGVIIGVIIVPWQLPPTLHPTAANSDFDLSHPEQPVLQQQGHAHLSVQQFLDLRLCVVQVRACAAYKGDCIVAVSLLCCLSNCSFSCQMLYVCVYWRAQA